MSRRPEAQLETTDDPEKFVPDCAPGIDFDGDREALAVARAEERERCAKAIEEERDRLFAEQGMTIGESCIFDICALHIRQLEAGEGQN